MAEPPVVRVMDFGKFLFEQNKKAHAAKRKQIYTEPGAGRSMTFAVSRVPFAPRRTIEGNAAGKGQGNE